MSRAAFRQTLDHLRTSYLFSSLIGVLVALLLVEVLLYLDGRVPNVAAGSTRLVLATSPEYMRSVMLDTAGTLLATAGIVFTLLTVPISLAASQFGSRLLRAYLRDGTIQFILALFVGAFAFCLSTAMAIPYTSDISDAPQITVTFGLALSLAAFGSIIVLIHHIAMMLQAPNLVAAVSGELQGVIRETYEDRDDRQVTADHREVMAQLASSQEDSLPIYARKEGYIQAVDFDLALKLAARHDLVIRLIRNAGYFVRVGEMVALVSPAVNVTDRVATNIRDAYRLGNQRTPGQDVEYGIIQIAEVAIRAMSPAINDPNTAMTCLDHLGARLSEISAQPTPLPVHFDDQGQLRLVADVVVFSELLSAAFDMLRRVSRDNAKVLLAMLNAIDEIGQSATSEQVREDLRRYVGLVLAESEAGALIAWDKALVEQRCQTLTARLAEG